MAGQRGVFLLGFEVVALLGFVYQSKNEPKYAVPLEALSIYV